MRWTIKKLVFAGYGVSLLLLIVLGYFAYQVTHEMLDAFEQRRLSNQFLNRTATLLSLIQDAETGQRGYILTGVDSYLEPHEKATEDIPGAIVTLKKLVPAVNGDSGSVSELERNVNDKLAELRETIDLRRSKGFQPALEVVATNRGKAQMDRIRQIITDLQNAQIERQEVINAQVLEHSGLLTKGIEIGVTGAAILMLLIGFVTARGLSEPMNRIADSARSIAEGDLDITLPKDSSIEEVCSLAEAFTLMLKTLKQSATLSERLAAGDLTVQVKPLSEADVVGRSQADMVAKLSDLIEQVQRSGVQVNSSAVQIAATTKEQQSTASEMASTTTEISTTAKEMSATSTELLTAADNVNAVSQQLAGLASSGKEGLLRMEHVMKQIMDASSSITSRLSEMNDRAGNIGSVVTTITKIADQTNLLSLNAAIEAEKAGEYGRGFSVVASEIRRLADQTAASTLDIEQMVKDMLGSVSAGVMGMDKFSEEVRRSGREVSEVSRQIDQMIEQVQSLAPSVESVYEGMRAQTQGSTQISEALSQLGDAARQTADVVRDSNRAVEQLNDATRILQTAISRFKLR